MAKQKWYRIYLYFLLEISRRIILWLPEKLSYTLAFFVGTKAFWILKRERKKTEQHLKKAFGPLLNDDQVSEIARKMFCNFSKTAVDICRFPKLTRAYLESIVRVEPEEIERLDQALLHEKGVIALTGHLGNWELLGAYICLSGYPGRLVGRKIYYDRYDQVVVYLRSEALLPTIYRHSSARTIVRELRKNHIVGISADQNVDHLEGINVPFFGEPAWTLVAPARLSLASGAPIIPMFMVHEESGYRLIIEEPIWPVRMEDKQESVRQLTFEWSRVMEKYIRKYPEQWTWMHNRWRAPVFKRTYSPSLVFQKQAVGA